MSRYYQHNVKTRDYVVVKHSLRGYEGELDGIRYRDGYGVVIKNSKQYRFLKNIRPVAIAEEFPITYLGKLSFVINEKQIEYIWGKSILATYRKELKKEEKPNSIEFNKESLPQCIHKKDDGVECKNKSLKASPYCRSHVIHDERIADDVKALGIMPKKQKKAAINQLIKDKIKAE